ncbi:MAG: helix-turn-helix domain-containing protein [Patescibacteria group bacterium]
MKECTSHEPVNLTLKIIGGKWKPLILWLLRDTTMRFSELSKQMPGTTQKMLTQQLRELEDDGLIMRKVYAEVPPRVEYSMTKYGLTLEPVLKAIHNWGVKHQERHKKSK